jgi:ureidoacrylate peracid hydrolase
MTNTYVDTFDGDVKASQILNFKFQISNLKYFMPPNLTPESLDHAVEGWLQRIAPFNHHEYKLASASALIVVDMQIFFLDEHSPTFTPGGLPIVGRVKALIDAFRRAGRPVIFTRHVHNPSLDDAGIMGWWWEGMCLEGTPESEVIPELAPLHGEKQILKHRYSAFYNTDLETVLRVLKVEDVVIAGVMTNLCCESTARDAYYRDYRVHFPADATGSISEELHVASLMSLGLGFARVTTTTKILQEIE